MIIPKNHRFLRHGYKKQRTSGRRDGLSLFTENPRETV